MANTHLNKLALGLASGAGLAVALVIPTAAQQKTTTLPDGKTVYISTMPGDSASVSTFLNRNVYNAAGEKLGDVNDLLLGPDHKVSTAVIGVGGFLGIGEKEVAVSFEALKVIRKDNTWQVVMDATRETLKAAPAFEHKRDASSAPKPSTPPSGLGNPPVPAPKL
jgi:sporulation protein YlmC with PRC-barrel domain